MNADTAVFANKPAWDQHGITLDTEGKKGLSVDETLAFADLDWDVEKVPMFATPIDQEEDPDVGMRLLQMRNSIEDCSQYGVQRSSDGKLLGAVGRVYTPVPNREGFGVLAAAQQIAPDELWIESAGTLDGGARCWILAHVTEDIFVAGDRIAQYIVFGNGHNGRHSITASLTNVRVQSGSTFAMRLRGQSRILRVRHTKTAPQRIQQAENILQVRAQFADALMEIGEKLAAIEMTGKQLDGFIAALFPIKKDATTPAKTMATNRRANLKTVYSKIDTAAEGTRWHALLAALEYSDYAKYAEAKKQPSAETQMKGQIGDAPFKKRALDILMKGVK
jgi:phage/plasmid-like protein (TIGR03299 family)